MIQPSNLILPGDPEFAQTLGCLPPDTSQIRAETNGDFALVARADTGLLEAVPWAVAQEYIYGGELDEREALMDLEDDYTGIGCNGSELW